MTSRPLRFSAIPVATTAGMRFLPGWTGDLYEPPAESLQSAQAALANAARATESGAAGSGTA